MASRNINDLDQPMIAVANEFIIRCLKVGLRVIIDCTYRSNEEQDVLYAQGRTTPGPIVTHARGGESAHNVTRDGKPSARAFDIAIYEDDSGLLLDWNSNSLHWRMAHDIGRSMGLNLGADWPSVVCDPPHFEMKNWQTAP